MLVLEEGGNLRIFVHPELRTVVTKNDLAYIEALLQDFLERSKLHPAALFKQLSSLGVGPLVANEVGENLLGNPPILELSSRFVELSSAFF